ncbi:endoplasmic reticulum aminopeptidase 1 isoform X2 [Anabrus simplex]|uniref:endoplasmic reticulum aminopeptidase 1 isoform X2 n=1 Tax=Anabrus simplex TaxID=316456 RepID=UPI0035A32985
MRLAPAFIVILLTAFGPRDVSSRHLQRQGVDLAEVTQLATDQNRTKRSHIESDNVLYRARLPKTVVPSSYQLMLQPYRHQGVFQGRVQINVTCLETTDKIVLHAHKELQISRAAVSVRRMGRVASSTSDYFDQDNQYDRYSESYLQVTKVIRDMKTSQCEILLSEPLIKGVTYQLDMPFSGQLSNDKHQGFYHSSNENNTSEMRWFIATHMKHGNARRVFPCFDEPTFKATFEVSVTRPINMKAISTMPIRTSDTVADEDGWVWDHFQITPPMSISSLIIFIFNPRNLFPVSPTVTQGGVSVQGFAQAADLSKAQAIVNYLAVGINYLERYLGVAFPLPQMNVIFLPDTSAPSEDYWGLLMAGDNFQAPVYLLQQWFGHLVTPDEGVAENLTTALAQYHAFICPMEVIEQCESSDSPAQGLQYPYTTQYDVGDKPTPQQFQLRKTIWLFRMLNYTLTERTFRRGIQNFLKSKGYSSFKQNDLWNTLDMQAWTYATLERTISTKQIANSWIVKDHYPVVTVTRNYKNNTALFEQDVFIKRWPYKIPGQESMLWWVPITYMSQENLDVHNISFITWMKEEREITIEDMPDSNSFIIINPEDIGMFIVNYDSNNWNMLAVYLVTTGAGDGWPLIPTATRAKLLHDAWYLAIGGRLKFATALNMIRFLRTETEVNVWKALAQVYFTISWKLAGTDAETKFDRFIGELMIHMYNKDNEENIQGYEDTAEIHALAHYVLCKAGHKEAIQRAREEFAVWLDDQKEISDGTLWGVFRWVDEDWERGLQRVLDLLHNQTSPGFRGFLLSQLVSSTIQPHKVQRILKILIIEDNYKFSDGEIKEVSAAVADSKTFLQFLDNYWDLIKKRFNTRVDIWQHILEQATRKFKTQEGYNRVLDFYAAHKYEEKVAGIMEQSLHVIRMSKEGICKNLPELERWMEQYLAQSEASNLFYSTEMTSSH